MDILVEVELVLRDSAFRTRASLDNNLVSFESDSVLGFVHLFSDVSQLIATWQIVQKSTLTRYAPSIREAADKAWNVYNVFLTADNQDHPARALDAIEEDFSFSRKIARASVQTKEDIQRALRPLLPIRGRTSSSLDNFNHRLRTKLPNVSEKVIDAFLGDVRIDDIAQLLRETP